MKKPFLFVNILFLIIFISCANIAGAIETDHHYQKYKKILKKHNFATPKKIGMAKFYDSNAKEVYLKDFQSKFIILNFWANWCVECISELKSLNQLQQKLNKLKIGDIEIIAISDNSIDFEKINNLYHKLNISDLKLYYDPSRNLMKDFNINSPPSTILINKQNKAFAKFHNTYNWQDPSIVKYILEIRDQGK